MLFQCNQMFFQEICASYENLSVIIEKGLDHFLTAHKAFKTQKELHHCLRLLEFLILKKNTIAVLTFLIPKNDSITFLGCW